jgi:hypothetical protein
MPVPVPQTEPLARARPDTDVGARPTLADRKQDRASLPGARHEPTAVGRPDVGGTGDGDHVETVEQRGGDDRPLLARGRHQGEAFQDHAELGRGRQTEPWQPDYGTPRTGGGRARKKGEEDGRRARDNDRRSSSQPAPGEERADRVDDREGAISGHRDRAEPVGEVGEGVGHEGKVSNVCSRGQEIWGDAMDKHRDRPRHPPEIFRYAN